VNEGPAGTKPSGLPARVQETRAKLQTLRLRSHDPELGSKSTKSSQTMSRCAFSERRIICGN
jgi:hypothetical protein